MEKKERPVPENKLDWLLNERMAREDAVVHCIDHLTTIVPRESRNPSPCDVATAVFIAASEYETAAAAVLIAASEVYTYASAVRIAAMEEMSRQCSPNG